MKAELKEELKKLVEQNKSLNVPGFVCIGIGNLSTPLGPKFGITRERLYTNGSTNGKEITKPLERGYMGDSPLGNYFITQKYYDALLNDTAHTLADEIEELDETTFSPFFEALFPELVKNFKENTQKNKENSEKNTEITKKTQKSPIMEETIQEKDRSIQAEFVKRNGLEIGSKVKVMRKFKDYGTTSPRINWAEPMEETIGKVGVITKIDNEYPSIWVLFKGEPSPNPFFSNDKVWCYPYHSLQPFYDEGEAVFLENTNVAIVKDDGSTLMNGLSVTFDELEDLYFKAGKAKTRCKSTGEIDDGSNETWKDSDKF